MIPTSFFIFSRRLTSLKHPVLSSYPSKLIRNSGYFRYSRSYTSTLLRKSTCTASLHKFGFIDSCNDFRTTKRYKQTSSDQEKSPEDTLQNEEPPEKLSLFQRYKKMLKEYWYVLLPVHFVTSAFWFGGFYYAATCGIDIVPFLEYINVPEQFIKPLRNSSLGYIAVASAFYKLATPARYMVTVGGTTVAVKVLVKRGLIRPAPTKDEMKTMIKNKLTKAPDENKP